MQDVNRFQKVLFLIFGFIAFVGNILGTPLIFVVIALLIKSWSFGIISVLIVVAIDFYRHSVFKRLGLTPQLGGYKKEDNDQPIIEGEI